MKTKYLVQKIDWKNIDTMDDYKKALQNSERKVCYGLKEVFDYCGGKLKRERGGYSGMTNLCEYIATRA